jgi:hypothetical protein
MRTSVPSAWTWICFGKWLELREVRFGCAVGGWWSSLDVDVEGATVPLKGGDDETVADLYFAVESRLRDVARLAAEKKQVGSDSDLALGDLESCAERAGVFVAISSLSAWLRDRLPRQVWSGVLDEDVEVVECVRQELYIVAGHFLSESSRGAMDAPVETEDVEDQSLRVARELAEQPQIGWPLVGREPTMPRAPGRFSKSHPLEIPMGIADLCDGQDRLLSVTPAEWVRHMLRYRTGQFAHGLRGRRVFWAMVNTLLLRKAAGEGHAVHRNMMRRQGGRIWGAESLTKGGLREMLQDEQAVRSLVHQLMVVGKDVRSTPMQWAYEGKKLDCAVKHLSWLPPWVRGVGYDQVEFVRLCRAQGPDGRWRPGHRVADAVGLGRIPSECFALNCAYNYACDIHRLNVGAEFGVLAVQPGGDVREQERFDFCRDPPDVVGFVVVSCAELEMKIVMPQVVPHSSAHPCECIAQFEVGDGGNLHLHGFGVGQDNLQLGRLREDARSAADAAVVLPSDGECESSSLRADDRVCDAASSASASDVEVLPGGDVRRILSGDSFLNWWAVACCRFHSAGWIQRARSRIDRRWRTSFGNVSGSKCPSGIRVFQMTAISGSVFRGIPTLARMTLRCSLRPAVWASASRSDRVCDWFWMR